MKNRLLFGALLALLLAGNRAAGQITLGVPIAPVWTGVLGGGPVSGTVVDSRGMAVPNAHVAVKWNALHPTVHSTWIDCFQVLATVTDAGGRFKVPSWHGFQPGLSDDGMEIYVFKQGYAPPTIPRQSFSKMLAQQAGNVDANLVLGEGKRSVLERLGEIKAFLPGCGRGGISEHNLVPYYRAVQEEIDALLATTDGQAIKQREEAAQAESRRTGTPRPSPSERIVLISVVNMIAKFEEAADTESGHEPAKALPPPAVTRIRACDSQGNCEEREVQPRSR